MFRQSIGHGFLLLAFCLTSSNLLADEEFLGQFLENLDWLDQLEHYELELVVRQSGDIDEHFYEDIKIIREVWNGGTDEFVIGTASGTSQLAANPPSQRDLAVSMVAYGNRLGAKREILNSNFALGDIVCPETQHGCRDAARGFKIGSFVFQFLIPVPGAADQELRALIKHASDIGEKISLDSVRTEIEPTKTPNGDDQKLRHVFITTESGVRGKPGKTVKFKYRVSFADDGFNKGKLVSIQKGRVKSRPNGEEFVDFYDRKVDVVWKEYSSPKAGDKIVLPYRVAKRFASNPSSKEYNIVERTSFKWIQLRESKDLGQLLSRIRTTVGSDQKRVNSLLNR